MKTINAIELNENEMMNVDGGICIGMSKLSVICLGDIIKDGNDHIYMEKILELKKRNLISK